MYGNLATKALPRIGKVNKAFKDVRWINVWDPYQLLESIITYRLLHA